jgi:hypothetical protein
MKSVIEILYKYSSAEFLDEKGTFNAAIPPSGTLRIQPLSKSPNRQPALSVLFLDHVLAYAKVLEMHFEITDLGWFPYYFRNDYLDYEKSIYRFNRTGEVIEVDHLLKREFIEAAEDWDRQLMEYGIENLVPAAGGTP